MEVNGPRAHANHLLHDRFVGYASGDRSLVAQPPDAGRSTYRGVVRSMGSDPLERARGCGHPACRFVAGRRTRAISAFTLATAVFRISETGVDYEVFDDLLHPPVVPRGGGTVAGTTRSAYWVCPCSWFPWPERSGGSAGGNFGPSPRISPASSKHERQWKVLFPPPAVPSGRSASGAARPARTPPNPAPVPPRSGGDASS